MDMRSFMKSQGVPDAAFAKTVTLGQFCKYMDVIAKSIHELRSQIQSIEEKGVVYRGGFNQSDEYKRGDLVSHGGSVFHCTRPTQGVRPTHSDEQKAFDHPWQLAVKRGRDAR